jgi:hypothetical protein
MISEEKFQEIFLQADAKVKRRKARAEKDREKLAVWNKTFCEQTRDYWFSRARSV